MSWGDILPLTFLRDSRDIKGILVLSHRAMPYQEQLLGTLGMSSTNRYDPCINTVHQLQFSQAKNSRIYFCSSSFFGNKASISLWEHGCIPYLQGPLALHKRLLSEPETEFWTTSLNVIHPITYCQTY